jgi:hypothetical protein
MMETRRILCSVAEEPEDQRSLADELASDGGASQRSNQGSGSSATSVFGRGSSFAEQQPRTQANVFAAMHAKMGVTPQDGFVIQKLRGQEDFEDWQREVFAYFRILGFNRILTGEERLGHCRDESEREVGTVS